MRKWRSLEWARGGGVLDISVGGEVRRGPSYPYPVKTDRIPIFDTLFKSTEVNIN